MAHTTATTTLFIMCRPLGGVRLFDDAAHRTSPVASRLNDGEHHGDQGNPARRLAGEGGGPGGSVDELSSKAVELSLKTYELSLKTHEDTVSSTSFAGSPSVAAHGFGPWRVSGPAH
jgi:hypothetical protein